MSTMKHPNENPSNSSKSRRFLRLTALFCCILLSGCGAAETLPGAETLPSDNTPTETETEEAKPTSSVPLGTDLNGGTVRIYTAPTQDAARPMFSAMETNGDVINDAVYRRNTDTEARLNVKLEFQEGNAADVLTLIPKTVQAGDDAFDIIATAQYQVVKILNTGVFLDTMDVPYIDVTKPWWAKAYIDALNIGSDRRYFLTGDITLEFLRWITCTYFNKTVYQNFFESADDLYQTVLDGKWTLDVVNEMTRAVYADLNQNNKTDKEDLLGCGVITAAVGDSLFYNAGGQCCVPGPDGMPQLMPVTDRTVSIMEKLIDLYYNNPSCCLFAETWDALNNEVTAKLASDQMLFMFGWLFSSDYLRDMKSDYGVIPIPKVDEAMEDYRALIHNDVVVFALPATCTQTEAAGAVLEEMAFQGYLTTSPTYYEIVLKDKYLRDSSDTAAKMIDLIHDHAFTDTGYVYASQIADAGYMQRTLLGAKKKDIASQYAKIETKAQTALSKLIEIYSGLES